MSVCHEKIIMFYIGEIHPVIFVIAPFFVFHLSGGERRGAYSFVDCLNGMSKGYTDGGGGGCVMFGSGCTNHLTYAEYKKFHVLIIKYFDVYTKPYRLIPLFDGSQSP